MQGVPHENQDIEKLNTYQDIKQLLPHIEKFVMDLGNNFISLEEKFNFVEKNNIHLKNILNSETVKFKKSNDAINDIKSENKFLKREQLTFISKEKEELLIKLEEKKVKKKKKFKRKDDPTITNTVLQSKVKSDKTIISKNETPKNIIPIIVNKKDNSPINTQLNKNTSYSNLRSNTFKNYNDSLNNNEIVNNLTTNSDFKSDRKGNFVSVNMLSNGNNYENSQRNLKIASEKSPLKNHFTEEDSSLKNFENLRLKIKNLENEKEKKIIESLREFRSKNMSKPKDSNK